MSRLNDLTGQKFGKLTVLYRSEDKVTPKCKKRTMWRCKCDCGNEKDISSSSLKRGTRSCGCLSKESSYLRRGSNNYDMSNEYGIGFTSNNNSKFYFDKEDFDKIKIYTWHESADGYIKTNDVRNPKDKKTISLHRLIMDAKKDDIVDHINHNVNDNRKSNLRICTKQQNIFNSSIYKNNTSGVKGVRKRGEYWFSSIIINGEIIGLGYHKDFNKAVEARKKAEKEYLGEWAYDECIGRGVINE